MVYTLSKSFDQAVEVSDCGHLIHLSLYVLFVAVSLNVDVITACQNITDIVKTTFVVNIKYNAFLCILCDRTGLVVCSCCKV